VAIRTDPPFDLVVVVDWSANNGPKVGADSIWTCVLDTADGAATTVNHPTRHAARDHLIDVALAAVGRRVLVGWDFPFGVPAGTAEAAQLPGDPPWRAVWQHLDEHLVDGPDNRSNRFEVAAAINARIGPGPGPFWGVPPQRATTPLSSCKAPGYPHLSSRGTLAEHRVAEIAMRERSGKRPFPVWQLLGAGSVGSQALTGIPVVSALRRADGLTDRSVVWPFETGLTLPARHPLSGRTDLVIHAEIWPSSIDVDRTVHPVKDAAQVHCLAHHLAALDRSGELAREFAPPLAPQHAADVVREEGWILGATLWP
jgi:precorrin-8X/cobalt-precorrin-8 methylmutase